MFRKTNLTNADLEKMVDTNDEWIRTRTGIEERRILKGEGMATSDMGVPAVIELCKKRGIDPEEIDCLIVAQLLLIWCFLQPQILFAINWEQKMHGVLILRPPVQVFYML